MASVKTSFFQLPKSQVVETVYVQLDDGRVVARTPDELAALPDELVPDVQVPSQS